MSAIHSALPNTIGLGLDANAVDPMDRVSGAAEGASLSRVRFEHAMAKADALHAPGAISGSQGVDATPRPEGFILAQATPISPATPNAGSTAPNVAGIAPTETDRTRALQGLDLSNEVAAVDTNGTGETIIDGLSKLRSVFDAQENAITGVSSSNVSGTALTNSSELINLQLEVVKYSMLMDVTSKLAGKSTQTFDTLMKGQ